MLRNAFAATIVAALALGAGVLSACQPNAVPGRGCAPEGDFGIGSAADGVNTYRCVNGRWEWSMTTQRAGELLKQAMDAKAAADAAAATTTTTAAPETTTTTTAPPPVPVVPASIEGCYFSPAIDQDFKVVHPAAAADWLYAAGIFASKDSSCTGDLLDSGFTVTAANDGEAETRCASLSPGVHQQGVVDPDVPALSALYICAFDA